MKRLLIVATLVAASAVVFSQPARSSANQKGEDEQAVRQVIKELAAALGTNDTAALDRIYADGYTFVGDTGILTTKAQRLAAFTSGEMKYESVSLDDANIRLYGSTAVATIHFTTKVASGVKVSDGKFITTMTFAKTKGRWQPVAAQSARIAGQ